MTEKYGTLGNNGIKTVLKAFFLVSLHWSLTLHEYSMTSVALDHQRP